MFTVTQICVPGLQSLAFSSEVKYLLSLLRCDLGLVMMASLSSFVGQLSTKSLLCTVTGHGNMVCNPCPDLEVFMLGSQWDL